MDTYAQDSATLASSYFQQFNDADDILTDEEEFMQQVLQKRTLLDKNFITHARFKSATSDTEQSSQELSYDYNTHKWVPSPEYYDFSQPKADVIHGFPIDGHSSQILADAYANKGQKDHYLPVNFNCNTTKLSIADLLLCPCFMACLPKHHVLRKHERMETDFHARHCHAACSWCRKATPLDVEWHRLLSGEHVYMRNVPRGDWTIGIAETGLTVVSMAYFRWPTKEADADSASSAKASVKISFKRYDRPLHHMCNRFGAVPCTHGCTSAAEELAELHPAEREEYSLEKKGRHAFFLRGWEDAKSW
ncbi:hypothetical protein LTR36_004799 [Oleoguttula mirabilis]|uniref:Uncharacterized protein n=1 Tax=Oleoguttula mirabilis TaxID=1507867 RepID=A0AAV9JGX3_9PEZI|nr:hypothetical protein LTR36_004799 [Oleoguttula mirabilis]